MEQVGQINNKQRSWDVWDNPDLICKEDEWEPWFGDLSNQALEDERNRIKGHRVKARHDCILLTVYLINENIVFQIELLM